jgi:LPS-assembly protein
VEHSIANDETNEANVSLIYQALCWSVELGSQYTPTDTSIMLMFNLANLGSPLRFYY